MLKIIIKLQKMDIVNLFLVDRFDFCLFEYYRMHIVVIQYEKAKITNYNNPYFYSYLLYSGSLSPNVR